MPGQAIVHSLQSQIMTINGWNHEDRFDGSHERENGLTKHLIRNIVEQILHLEWSVEIGLLTAAVKPNFCRTFEVFLQLQLLSKYAILIRGKIKRSYIFNLLFLRPCLFYYFWNIYVWACLLSWYSFSCWSKSNLNQSEKHDRNTASSWSSLSRT